MTVLVGVGVPDRPEGWRTLGFAVVDAAIPFANGALLLGREGLVVTDNDRADPLELPGDLEGIPLTRGEPLAALPHDADAVELDHVVVLTDSLERTSSAVHVALGLECRRVRETDTVRQAFHRFGDTDGRRGCIIEVVESQAVDVTTMMGVVVNVADLHALTERLGPDVVSPPKAAIQPGRFIATVRRQIGLGTAVALMTPDER